MTARTPASARRRSRLVDGGRPSAADALGAADAPDSADAETPAGLPAGVEPGSRMGGVSI
jgi:hypothetical protein